MNDNLMKIVQMALAAVPVIGLPANVNETITIAQPKYLSANPDESDENVLINTFKNLFMHLPLVIGKKIIFQKKANILCE